MSPRVRSSISRTLKARDHYYLTRSDIIKNVSEYDQEVPQSLTAYQPTAS